MRRAKVVSRSCYHSRLLYLYLESNFGTSVDPEGFIRVGSTRHVFLVDEGVPSTTISGPSSARQQNTIKWRFAGRSNMADNPGLVALNFFRGSGPVLLRNPIFM